MSRGRLASRRSQPGEHDHVRQQHRRAARERASGTRSPSCKAPCNRSHRHRLPAGRRPTSCSTPASSATPGRRPPAGVDLDDARRPARRHLHLLLPDPPVHAGRVPGRGRVSRGPPIAPPAAPRGRAGASLAARAAGAAPGGRGRALVVRAARRRARARRRSGTERPRPAPTPAPPASRGRGRSAPATVETVFVGYRIEELFGGETIKKDGGRPHRRGGGHAGQRRHRPSPRRPWSPS